jgi:hypothetical protein
MDISGIFEGIGVAFISFIEGIAVTLGLAPSK